MNNYKELLQNVNTFIFDYDGVFTNGVVVLTEKGEPMRTANVKDGYAVQLAVKNGYRLAVISGGRSDTVINRLKSLNVKDIFLGVGNKIEKFREYLAEHAIKPEEVVYMGDDIPDYEIMKEVGVPTCPADAAEEIKAVSVYISHQNGGEGCVRDILEQVMKVQGKWMTNDGYLW